MLKIHKGIYVIFIILALILGALGTLGRAADEKTRPVLVEKVR